MLDCHIAHVSYIIHTYHRSLFFHPVMCGIDRFETFLTKGSRYRAVGPMMDTFSISFSYCSKFDAATSFSLHEEVHDAY
jgi:hypothetical protein